MSLCCCKSGSWMFPVIAAAGVGVGVIVGMGVSDEPGDAEGSLATAALRSQPEMEMSDEMRAWMEAGTPGAEHKALERFVGEWSAEATFRESPDAPEMTSDGRQVSEMIYGGRFVRSNYEGDFGGEPFHGMSIMGYDKVQKKYVSLWIDDMSTMIYTDSGEYDESSKAFTMTARFKDPLGNDVRSKHVTRFESDDRIVFEMHKSADGGEWFKSGTIVYTRN